MRKQIGDVSEYVNPLVHNVDYVRLKLEYQSIISNLC